MNRNVHLPGRTWGRVEWYVLLLVLLGVAVRVAQWGSVPAGLNQDEAFAGYEAYSLLHYGVDSMGYRNPCYFVSWGSGMNVLESYLAIPAMMVLGCTVAALRLPQLLCACVSLPVFYLLLRRMFGTRVAVLGLGVLAISPWHIMLSRWGLESNLAPAFLLFGLYCFVLGVEKHGAWLVASAALYGLALYAYAITWAVVPLVLVLSVGCVLQGGRRLPWKWAVAAAVVLGLLALPLLLFLLVNRGILPEIRTPFLSVPRLLYMREGEFSPENLLKLESYQRFLEVFAGQNDNLPWNSTPEFGLYYPFSLPLMLLGGSALAGRAWAGWKARTFTWAGVVAVQTVAVTLVCLMLGEGLNVNKGNSLHFLLLILLALGLDQVWSLCRNHPPVPGGVAAGYALAFAGFVCLYFGGWNEQIGGYFHAGLEQAVAYVKAQGFTDVCVDDQVTHAQILFFDQTPQPEYAATVEYANYPAAYLRVTRFGRYTFADPLSSLGEHQAYIAPAGEGEAFAAQGYAVEVFDGYAVAYLDTGA